MSNSGTVDQPRSRCSPGGPMSSRRSKIVAGTPHGPVEPVQTHAPSGLTEGVSTLTCGSSPAIRQQSRKGALQDGSSPRLYRVCGLEPFQSDVGGIGVGGHFRPFRVGPSGCVTTRLGPSLASTSKVVRPGLATGAPPGPAASPCGHGCFPPVVTAAGPGVAVRTGMSHGRARSYQDRQVRAPAGEGWAGGGPADRSQDGP